MDGQKSGQKGRRNCPLSRGELPKLTLAEQEVLTLLNKEFLTAKQISQRRQTELSRTYKIIKNLKKKGLWNGVDKIGHFSGECSQKVDNRFIQNQQIRLHGEVYRFEVLSRSLKYQGFIGQSILHENSSVVCFTDVIMIHSGKSFFGVDVPDATRQACLYWTNYAVQLEHLLGVKLLKPRAQNFKRTRSHYAHINNELAQQCHEEGSKVQIRASEDGRVWFTIDNSFNFKEAETQHPKTAEPDMQGVAMPFFNDLRDFFHKEGFVPKPSEMWQGMAQNQAFLGRLSEDAIKPLTEQIQLHLAVMQEIKTGIRDLSSAVKGVQEKPLDALKSRVLTLDDVFKEKAAIEALTDAERALFLDWLFEKFGGGAL